MAQNKDFSLDAPNNNFLPIELQTYQGLPRFGVLNGMGKDNPGMGSKELSYQDITRWNYKRYFSLVELFFFEKFYDKLNSDNLLTNYGPASIQLRNDKDQLYNYIAQEHLLKIAPILCADETFAKYFKNHEGKSVYLNFSRIWGGRGSDEFRQLELFKDFTVNHLKTLRDWSIGFWENDSLEAYLVSVIDISSKYDFVKEGLWSKIRQDAITQTLKESITDLNFNFHGYSRHGSPTSIKDVIYIGRNSYERNSGYKQVLIPMSSEEAKSIQNEYGTYPHLYLVQKIKIELLKISSRGVSGQIDLSYSIASPSLDIFLDPGLKNKITSLNYNNDF